MRHSWDVAMDMQDVEGDGPIGSVATCLRQRDEVEMEMRRKNQQSEGEVVAGINKERIR